MMDAQQQKKISKFLSLVLRHKPETIGLTPDAAGWVSINQLLQGLAAHGRPLVFEELAFIVEHNDKRRFEFDVHCERIRASQGHSIPVDLGYTAEIPPAILFHGTTERFVNSIRTSGLQKQSRHHVHLHEDVTVARQVGQRRGAVVIFQVDAATMSAAGIEFYRSTNDVWLVDSVPPEYLQLADPFSDGISE